jgi:lipid II:glycine glycyltransferase (peptidoglycan interpeptide bridge formation enzyme)
VSEAATESAASGGRVPILGVAAVAPVAPADWDERAVRVPGGHVYQSAAWAAYRASQGREPRFVELGDGGVALVLLRRSSGLPGVEAVIRRGPAHGGRAAATLAQRAAALADWARSVGARDLFLDPERDADPAYESAMDAIGSRVADELDPSLHVMRLDLAGATHESLWEGLSKSTKQRIRAAESSVSVREDRTGERFEAMAALLRERADVLGIGLQEGQGYLRGWRVLVEAGLARLLVAEHQDELVGGLFIHLHGGIHATAYSADRADRRRDLPGAMHLVRWRAIRDAFAAGARAIELGGVDLPGHREPPSRGDPTWGLYENKRSFGARWVERSPARRIVLRPWAERLARLRRTAVDTARRVRR